MPLRFDIHSKCVGEGMSSQLHAHGRCVGLPLKTRQLVRSDLDDFVSCYNADNRHERHVTERFRPFTYDELMARDKASLDILWLRDESLEDTDNLPAPEVIAAEIVEDLEAALAEFSVVATSLSEGAKPA